MTLEYQLILEQKYVTDEVLYLFAASLTSAVLYQHYHFISGVYYYYNNNIAFMQDAVGCLRHLFGERYIIIYNDKAR